MKRGCGFLPVLLLAAPLAAQMGTRMGTRYPIPSVA